jgi:4-hydroxy-L-threonine phosphate dehydrogenase PdxA
MYVSTFLSTEFCTILSHCVLRERADRALCVIYDTAQTPTKNVAFAETFNV